MVEYYFKFKITNLEEYAEYYEKLAWLGHMDIIDKKIKD